MNQSKNTLLQFVAGVAMLALGLFIFSQKVVVYTSFFSGLRLGGINMTSGMIVIPLIIGIVWLFINFDSIGAKILIVVGILIIIFSVILSTQIHLTAMSLYEWILLLVLIFGGLGLVAKTLFAGNSKERHYERKGNDRDYSQDIEQELKRMKEKNKR